MLARFGPEGVAGRGPGGARDGEGAGRRWSAVGSRRDARRLRRPPLAGVAGHARGRGTRGGARGLRERLRQAQRRDPARALRRGPRAGVDRARERVEGSRPTGGCCASRASSALPGAMAWLARLRESRLAPGARLVGPASRTSTPCSRSWGWAAIWTRSSPPTTSAAASPTPRSSSPRRAGWGSPPGAAWSWRTPPPASRPRAGPACARSACSRPTTRELSADLVVPSLEAVPEDAFEALLRAVA